MIRKRKERVEREQIFCRKTKNEKRKEKCLCTVALKPLLHCTVKKK